MNFYGGGGGPFSVLLGLFIFLFVFLGRVLVCAIVLAILLLVWIGRGIRALYRHHKAKKIRTAAAKVRTDDLPMPPTSPVRHPE